MPLTKRGEVLKRKFEQEYGSEKGKKVFYASINSGRLKGVHRPHPEVADVHRRKRSY